MYGRLRPPYNVRFGYSIYSPIKQQKSTINSYTNEISESNMHMAAVSLTDYMNFVNFYYEAALDTKISDYLKKYVKTFIPEDQ